MRLSRSQGNCATVSYFKDVPVKFKTSTKKRVGPSGIRELRNGPLTNKPGYVFLPSSAIRSKSPKPFLFEILSNMRRNRSSERPKPETTKIYSQIIFFKNLMKLTILFNTYIKGFRNFSKSKKDYPQWNLIQQYMCYESNVLSLNHSDI